MSGNCNIFYILVLASVDFFFSPVSFFLFLGMTNEFWLKYGLFWCCVIWAWIDSTFSFSWLSRILLSRRSGWWKGQVDHSVSTPKEELLVGPWGGGGFAPHWAITDISLGDSHAWKTYDALLVLPIWLPLPPLAGMASLLLDSGECPDPATLGFLRPHPTGGESK